MMVDKTNVASEKLWHLRVMYKKLVILHEWGHIVIENISDHTLWNGILKGNPDTQRAETVLHHEPHDALMGTSRAQE